MTETLIVGGGLAGGAAAALLALDGARVLLLEREAEPRHKICGEFLSIEGRRHLAALGLDLARLGGAPISRLRLVSGSRVVEANLPFTALGLTRRRLDEALLNHAESLGARIERGAAARSLMDGAVTTTLGDFKPHAILLATGKHDLRGAKRDTTGAVNRYIGFKMYFRIDTAVRAALDGVIEVILFKGGYAGLQLVEDSVANLCLLVRADIFAALGRTWNDLLARLVEEPHLDRRLGGAEALLERPLTISGVPYGFIHRDSAGAPTNLFRLGDQATVIPSFCGDGMAIALHSGRLAARAVLSGANALSYHDFLRRDVRRQVRSATALQRLGGNRFGQSFILAAAAIAPSILSAMASWSRVPDRALRDSGISVSLETRQPLLAD